MRRLSNTVRFVALMLAIGALAASSADAASKKEQRVKARTEAKAKTDAKAKADAAKADTKPKSPPGIWSYGRDAEAFVLQYGVAKAAAPFLVATCRPGAGLFQIVVEISPPKAQAGDAVRLTLGNGKTVVEFAASTFPSVTQGRRAVEAQAKLEPKLVEVFKNADQLKVTVTGATETLPLASAQKKLPAFEAGCLKARILPSAKN
jgi:hypothetical protein